MLQESGFSSFDDLFRDIPQEVKLKGELSIPAGLSELEVRRDMSALANKNVVFPVIVREVPVAIPSFYSLYCKRALIGKENFLTAYTPYQAETSQGILQSILNIRP